MDDGFAYFFKLRIKPNQQKFYSHKCNPPRFLFTWTWPVFNQSLLKQDWSIPLKKNLGKVSNSLLFGKAKQSCFNAFSRLLHCRSLDHVCPSIPPSYLSSLQSIRSAVQCWTTAVTSCRSQLPGRSASLCPPRTPSHLT